MEIQTMERETTVEEKQREAGSRVVVYPVPEGAARQRDFILKVRPAEIGRASCRERV